MEKRKRANAKSHTATNTRILKFSTLISVNSASALCKAGMHCGRTTSVTQPHWAFSSNLFHGQIVQIAIPQLSDSENKKCSPRKVFGTNNPQNQLLLSRRSPRSPDARLSQHYIGPKMTFRHFSNFCRKKFPGLTKRLLHIFIQFWGL